MRILFLLTLLGATTAFVARPSIVQRSSIPSTKESALASSISDVIKEESGELLGLPARPGRPLKIAIAGGGVGGLTAALCMLKKGFDVTVYEKTAAFARFGG